MIHVSEPMTAPPAVFQTDLHRSVYETLEALQIPFCRVDNDPAITMDDCVAIEEKLQTPIVKTLFLCNRQQTDFYLFVTTANKPFKTKFFSKALEISRVSFATPEQLLSMLGTNVGATSVLSLLHDPDHRVHLSFDRDALRSEWYGCTDTTTTDYMKLPTKALFDLFLPHTGHKPVLLTLETEDETA